MAAIILPGGRPWRRGKPSKSVPCTGEDLAIDRARRFHLRLDLGPGALVREAVPFLHRRPETVDPVEEELRVLGRPRRLARDLDVYRAGVGVDQFALDLVHGGPRNPQRQPA